MSTLPTVRERIEDGIRVENGFTWPERKIPDATVNLLNSYRALLSAETALEFAQEAHVVKEMLALR
jgi:hypothetical protein